ncbi:unnamed protein product [Ectocarpus sp. 12 AP-2014]
MMDWVGYKVTRLVILLLLSQACVLCSGFVPGVSPSASPYLAHHTKFSPDTSTTSAAGYDFFRALALGSKRSGTADAVTSSPRRGPMSRLSMSMSPSPPVKPPPKKRTGGGGNGDELFVRELIEPEKSVILTSWRDYAQRDGGEKFAECIEILNKMVAWRSGVVAARKRRFTLACCKGSSVQAVACVQIGPKNESVRSFLAQEACMSVCLLNVDPSSPKFKAGAHLCREIKEIGKLENMAVSFDPIKDIYSGRFYAATLAM